MKNQNSELRLFAAALNYASKIAHGDPEYTLEKAEKIFPPRYFAMIAKEYSNLMELDRYAKTRRVLLTKASWSYQHATFYIQFADRQINELREFNNDWLDTIGKLNLDDDDYKIIMGMSKALDGFLAGLAGAQNKLKKWLYEVGLLQNNASIDRALEKVNKLEDSLIKHAVETKESMINLLHKIINKETKNE